MTRARRGHSLSAQSLDVSRCGRYSHRMDRDRAQAYVRQWAETGRLLEEQRWQELAALDKAHALTLSDALIEAALRVPLPRTRRSWSGLVELQDLLHRRSR